MIITVSREQLVKFLKEEIRAWESVGGGPNVMAFEFNPETVDIKLITQLGYYDNREAWIAGVRIKALQQKIQEIQDTPDFAARK
jgi:hypothetical protein